MSVPKEYRTFVACLDPQGQKLANLKYNLGSKTVFLFQMIARKEFRLSLGVKSPSPLLDSSIHAVALRKKNKIVKELMSKDKKDEHVKLLICDIINEIIKMYRTQKESGSYKPSTYQGMVRAFDRLSEYWGEKFPHEITREEWDKFQDWHELTYPGQGQFSFTKYMRVLRSYCVEKGYIKHRPSINDRNAKKDRARRKKKKARVYSDQEIIALERACRSTKELIIIKLGYQMAFRISDCVQLKWSRLFLDEPTPYITFSEGEDKADFSGKCPIPDELVTLFRTFPRVSEWVLPHTLSNNQHMLPQNFNYKELRIRAGVTWGTFHTLRHYRLTHDFMNPKFTAAQVCLIRRVSMQTAYEHYLHTRREDMELLRNAGQISMLAEFSENKQKPSNDIEVGTERFN